MLVHVEVVGVITEAFKKIIEAERLFVEVVTVIFRL